MWLIRLPVEKPIKIIKETTNSRKKTETSSWPTKEISKTDVTDVSYFELA